jgi:hypothetical protein
VNIDYDRAALRVFIGICSQIPNTPLGVGNAALEQAQRCPRSLEKIGQDVLKKVVKNYPTTTHARPWNTA